MHICTLRRCTRLSMTCTPHMPNKKRRGVGPADDDDDVGGQAETAMGECDPSGLPSAPPDLAGSRKGRVPNKGGAAGDGGFPMPEFFDECFSPLEAHGGAGSTPSMSQPPALHNRASSGSLGSCGSSMLLANMGPSGEMRCRLSYAGLV